MSDREDKMSSIKEYRFFRSFSTKIENWSQRKAEALWRKMREKKIAGIVIHMAVSSSVAISVPERLSFSVTGNEDLHKIKISKSIKL